MQRIWFGFALEEIFFLFIVGCVIGFVVETLYCLACTGKIMSRKGMVYGPFNQVYGFGAVFLMLLLSPLKHRRNRVIFLVGSVAGGLFEVICSFFQEKVFRTVSWQYSDQSFALFGGRTSLKYMAYWGVLSTVYLRVLHPAVFSLFHKIPAGARTVLVAAVMVFLAYNLLLSALAIYRWQARREGKAAAGRLWRAIDRTFPDRRMERIYPNMVGIAGKTGRQGTPAPAIPKGA